MAVKYRTHGQVALEEIAGRFFLVAYGAAAGNLPYLCEINNTAAYYWQLVEAGYNSDDMLVAASNEYDASPEILQKGLQYFLRDLGEKGYLLPKVPGQEVTHELKGGC